MCRGSSVSKVTNCRSSVPNTGTHVSPRASLVECWILTPKSWLLMQYMN